MTSPLRRKRPTTAPGRSTPARTPAKALGLAALLLAAGVAPAQQAAPRPWTPGPPAAAPAQRAMFQPMHPGGGPGVHNFDEKSGEQPIQLEPPGPQRLFRLESEDALKERWRQELQDVRPFDPQIYPDEPILTRETYY